MKKGKGRKAQKFAEERMSREQRRIAQWLKQVEFRKTLLGGVSERDVWKKIGELNEMYNVALAAERARYDALLEKQLREAQSDHFDTIPGGIQ